MEKDASLYYTPPEDSQFEELRAEAIRLWETYDNEYGYVTDKVGRIKSIPNFKDNFMYIFAMFDMDNQHKLAYGVSESTRKAIKDRLIAGGMPTELMPF